MTRRKINKKVSDLASTNSMEVKYVANQLYQAWGSCFSPYRDLLRRQTRLGYTGSTNLVGKLQYTIFERVSCRNTFFTSS
jgi:hypothetical protein